MWVSYPEDLAVQIFPGFALLKAFAGTISKYLLGNEMKLEIADKNQVSIKNHERDIYSLNHLLKKLSLTPLCPTNKDRFLPSC